jgi:O-antigen/teichoic acid export membrane protein
VREGLSLASIHVANSFFLQLERLLLAPVAGVQALALFGVVASLVTSPFRMLQMGVLFTLIPSLRNAAGLEERRRLLAREALLVGAVIGAGSVAIWYLAPPLAHWFLSGRYELSPRLMCAALVSGALKLCSAFATGTVIALGEANKLRKLSLVSWATIGVGALAAFLAASWGLVGVLYGISAGWLVRTLIAAWMAMPHLRRPAAPLPEALFADQSQMPRARR